MNSFSCRFIKPWTNSFIDRTLGYAIKASQCNAEEAFQNVFFYNFTYVEEGKKCKLSIQCFDRFPGFSSLWSVISCLMPQPMFLSAQAIYRIWESCCWWYLHFVWTQLSLTARHFLALSVIWIYWIILTKLDHISRKGGITSSLSIFILFQCVTKYVQTHSCMMDWRRFIAGICDLCRQGKDNPETFYWNSHRSLRNKLGSWGQGTRDVRCIGVFRSTFLFLQNFTNCSQMLIIHWNRKLKIFQTS